MAVNGIISFGARFTNYIPILFPTDNIDIYVLAPYWADHDIRLYGNVSWEMYSTGDTPTTDDIIDMVNNFINNNTNETDFVGHFMFVGFWEETHPFPAGSSETQAAPYLTSVSLR